MSTTLDILQQGADLHGELCQVLLQERSALVAQTLDGIDQANQQRETVLERLANWSDQTQGVLQEQTTESAPVATLGALVAQLPAALRRQGDTQLSRLRAQVEEAHELAASNHILVSRNMDLVRRTLAFYTGGTTASTYSAQGAVADTSGHPVVQARG